MEIVPTMESIVNQSFSNFEHIVVDGASKDDTVAVIRKFSPRSRILSEPDRGLYDAMNKGLDMARGKYLLFLNAGDAFHSFDTLQQYANAIIENNNPDIIYGDTEIVDTNRVFLRNRHLSVPETLTFESFANGMLICHQAFMVRRELADYYNLEYKFSADYDWTLRCIRKSNPARNINLHEVTIDYLESGLTDRNHKSSLKERYDIMCKFYGTMPTIFRHIKFLGRALARKITSDKLN